MRVHAQMKMSDLVHLNFEILLVLQRLSIPFGFKEKSVSAVCKESNVDVNFFMALTQWFFERDEFPQEELMVCPPHWLLGYLKHTHGYYLDYQIPRLEKEIEQLSDIITAPGKSIQLMIHFFKEYIREFSEHIEDEEKIAFPYIQSLEEVVNNNGDINEFRLKYSEYTIVKYLEGHTNLEEKIFDLQNILLKYVSPPTDNMHFTNLLIEIYRLGKDLKDHTLLEENVLVPKVKELELQLAKLASNK